MADVRTLFDLAGKRALITGGSRGLGFEIAEGLAEAGAAVFLAARREKWLDPAVEALRKRGFDARGASCDVADPASAAATCEAALAAFGGIDILVNAAGVTWGAPPEEMPLDKWRMVLDVNLTGAWLFSQRIGRDMLGRRSGSIINIASIAGLAGSVGEGLSIPAYSASKAGMLGLTRELAAQWGRRGLRVNAVAPGFFPTRMTEKILERIRSDYEALAPLGRVGREGEIKGAVVFLASEASSYVTGHTLVVDGGATAV